jgi:UDP-N-acetyl-D-mannosaminuronic acid transferase (WecB/TagA/CpsF family)
MLARMAETTDEGDTSGRSDEAEAPPARAIDDVTWKSLEPPAVAAPVAPRKLRPSEGVSGQTNARLTLVGTALVFGVTLLAWGGAKVACNLHPPRYEAFKESPLTRLAATPKDGALEFQHRLEIRDFTGARELAAEDGMAIVEGAQSECDTVCLAHKDQRPEEALTRAVLLRREGRTAIVRAETFFRGEKTERVYRLEWVERLWRVVGLEE